MAWEDNRNELWWENSTAGNRVLTCLESPDKKCPFTGLVSIRGRILTGTVVSTKMHRTIIIRREYLHFIPKYSRYEKRHKNLAVHVSPAFRVVDGDQVTVGQCRPLSKTVCGQADPAPRLKNRGADILTDLATGPIQRSPCAAPNWQGCQEVQQVLIGRNSSSGIYGVKHIRGHKIFPTGGSGTGSLFSPWLFHIQSRNKKTDFMTAKGGGVGLEHVNSNWSVHDKQSSCEDPRRGVGQCTSQTL